MRSGADSSGNDENGIDMITYAKGEKAEEVVCVILENGATVNEREEDISYENTALHTAIALGESKCLEALLEFIIFRFIINQV